MKKNKKTSIKIKKSKHNLYNKKKNKQRQTLTLVLTIVIACVLGVVGYGIGKPIVNYFQTRGEQGSDSSDNSENSQSEVLSESSESSLSESSEPETPPKPAVEDIKLYVLPIEATSSSAALGSALAAAKEAGYDTVAVTLKDEEGHLFYKTTIERVRYDTIIGQGTLTAAQIADQIENAGLSSAARINVLKDRITPMYFGSYAFESGIHWLDDYPPPEGTGKRWLSPFESEAVNYLSNIAAELAEAGFDHVICANIRYPKFYQTDIDTYLAHLQLNDREKRLKALWELTDYLKTSVEGRGSKLWVELDGADIIKADTFGTSAELAANGDKLSGVGVIAEYSAAGTEEIYESALAFADSFKKSVEGSDIAVLVKRGTSGTVSEDIRRAFEEKDLRLFIEN